MKTRIILMMTMRWLAVILVLAFVPWLAVAGPTTITDEEFDQAALNRELVEAAGLGDLPASKHC